MKKKLCFFSLLPLFFLFSCKIEKLNYFPLGDNLAWYYKVTILPEIEQKTVYKKFNSGLKKLKISDLQKNKYIDVYPIRREDNSLYFYSQSNEGIKREGVQYNKSKSLILEKKKRFVLKYPIEKGNKWESIGKTFLILRRYAYFDYKASANFKLQHEIVSTSETVNVPAGKFRNCLKILGNGETTFIGDSEIGTIRIKIRTTDWYAPNVGLIRSERIEETDTDLFGTTKMIQELDSYVH